MLGEAQPQTSDYTVKQHIEFANTIEPIAQREQSDHKLLLT